MSVIPEKLNRFISASTEELELLYRQMVNRPSPEPWQDRHNLISRMNAMLLSGYTILVELMTKDPTLNLGYAQLCLL